MAYSKGPFNPLWVLVILLLLKSGGNSIPDFASITQKLPIQNFSKDMHRLVSMMDSIESMGTMSQLSQDSSNMPSLSDGINALSMPNMNQLMEMAGPLLSMLGRQD